MTKRQHNKYNMKMTVAQVLLRDAAITTTLGSFGPLFELYQGYNLDIERLRRIQENDNSGVTLDKEQLKSKLENLIIDTSCKLVAYYDSINNNSALKSVRFLDSDVKTTSDARLTLMAKQLIEFAEKDLASLGSFDITAADIAVLATTVQHYTTIMKTPLISRSDIAGATKELEATFKKSDEVEKKMDTQIKILRLKQPVFFEAYTNARKINDLGGRTLSFKASAKDSSGQPLSNVTFEILKSEELRGLKASTSTAELSKPLLTKKTSEKGSLQIKNLPDGTYSALVKKLGFEDKEVQFHVVAGELVHLNVTMQER